MTKDEAVKKMQAVKFYITDGNPIRSFEEMGEAFDMAIDALEQPERKTGKWIREPFDDTYAVFRCSVCLKEMGLGDKNSKWYNFCPNCGAEMGTSHE